jgi:hypothetical protein
LALVAMRTTVQTPHLARMLRTVGEDLWRVRVDLFVDEADADSFDAMAERLGSRLTGDNKPEDPGEFAIDHGLGVTARPVLGLLFWVRADDVGGAARSAVDAARSAASECGMTFDLYDVTLIPAQAVVLPVDPLLPVLPD